MKDLIEAVRRCNEKGIPFLQRHDEDEPIEDREEDVNEASDLDLMGRFERFTPRS